MSLEKIVEFLDNRDLEAVEALLEGQLADTRSRLDELHRIEKRLMRRLGLRVIEGSVEVTSIDAGLTGDEFQFLTELQIPVRPAAT